MRSIHYMEVCSWILRSHLFKFMNAYQRWWRQWHKEIMIQTLIETSLYQAFRVRLLIPSELNVTDGDFMTQTKGWSSKQIRMPIYAPHNPSAVDQQTVINGGTMGKVLMKCCEECVCHYYWRVSSLNQYILEIYSIPSIERDTVNADSFSAFNEQKWQNYLSSSRN